MLKLNSDTQQEPEDSRLFFYVKTSTLQEPEFPRLLLNVINSTLQEPEFPRLLLNFNLLTHMVEMIKKDEFQ